MIPFPVNSPPSRIGSSVSSPSLIVSNEQPTLASSKRRNPKPFLLRSTTPLNVRDKEKKDEGNGGGKEQAVKMVRSKTDSSLGIHSTTKSPSPPALPPPTTSSNPRRSSRPLSTSTNRDTIPVRASRKITFVPDSKPSTTSRAVNPRPSSSTSAARAQAVEKQKMDLKRESLLSRRTNCGGNEDSENVNPAGLPQSKRRWSLRPLQDPPRPPRSIAHLSLASLTSPDSPSPQNRRPRSRSPAAPSNLSRTSTSNLRDRLTISLTAVKPIEEPCTESLPFDSPIYSRPPLRGPSPSAPTPPSATSRQLQKRASYAGLSRVPRAEASRLESSGESEESNSGTDCAGQTGAGEATVSRNSGYTSLHEILAERGYQDTRVLTPMSKARAKTNNLSTDPSRVPEPSTSLLAPPPPQIKEKSSMLSLRGLFSLWGPTSEVETMTGDETKDDGDAVRSESEDSPPSPGGTYINSPISRAREWVEGVAIANTEHERPTTRISSDRSPATESISTCASPPFQYSISTDESPVSCRSYSSSIVTASSIRSPPQVTIALPQSTVALSPPSFHRFPSTISSPKPAAVKSLRHAVSDSTLPQHLPHYHSFPFSPSSLDSSPSSPATEHLTSPSSSHLRAHALAPPVTEAQTSWLPNALRQRASQVFSLPMVGLGLTSTTSPLFPHQAMQQAQSGIARSRNASIQVKSGDKKPRLLRKAVSSAGLVRPVLTTTNY